MSSRIDPAPSLGKGRDSSVKPRPVPVAKPVVTPNLDDPRFYINRELSLLEFQRRVLEEAKDPQNPLLERIKFLAIVGSNLDEFFMVRVAGLKEQVAAGVVDLPPDGMTPTEQLASINEVAAEIMREARQCLTHELLPQLEAEGISVLSYSQLDDGQRAAVKCYFNEMVFPVLTPLAFDPGRPFPHISNLSLNLAVLIRDRKGQEYFARVKVPGTLPRLLPVHELTGSVPSEDGLAGVPLCFTWLEEVIAANLQELFPGMEILEAHPFRVVRNADMVIQELEAGDLLETIEEQVRQRRFGTVVRVTLSSALPAHIREILIKNLELHRKDVYDVEGMLGLSGLMSLAKIDRRDLKAPSFVPATPTELQALSSESDIFAMIRQRDILLHHPYDSFGPVVDFLKQAARDPDVLAIKQALYRVEPNSPIMDALLEARENGKQVSVLVELKARFDEESNIHRARALERQGVHVVYGLLGLKTHSKVALVVRKEGEHIRRYIHLSTGNYNAVTAHLYTDLGLFTCDDEIGADATDLFNYLTGYSRKKSFRKLLVAPINLRGEMARLIKREIEHQANSGQGRLIFVMNSLVDRGMIKLVYQASKAGVEIDLLVRGICCLRPGIEGVSENIRVTSIVGRFLEHGRVYYFHNGGREEVYLGSADLMPRNINSRVEALYPMEDSRLVKFLRQDVLGLQLSDTVKARRLLPDGVYQRVCPKSGQPAVNSQEMFLERRRGASSSRRA